MCARWRENNFLFSCLGGPAAPAACGVLIVDVGHRERGDSSPVELLDGNRGTVGSAACARRRGNNFLLSCLGGPAAPAAHDLLVVNVGHCRRGGTAAPASRDLVVVASPGPRGLFYSIGSTATLGLNDLFFSVGSRGLSAGASPDGPPVGYALASAMARQLATTAASEVGQASSPLRAAALPPLAVPLPERRPKKNRQRFRVGTVHHILGKQRRKRRSRHLGVAGVVVGAMHGGAWLAVPSLERRARWGGCMPPFR